KPSPTLQELNVTVLDARMCNNSRFWHGELGPAMICFQGKHAAPAKVSLGSKGPKNPGPAAGEMSPWPWWGHSPLPPPPQGDSGGPLVCGERPAVAGVMSFSSKKATDPFKPPVATSTVKYKKWIQKTLR
ncbi:GRAM protein, partial [Prunella fulvescens]|nr:GRAM protein [Prunella fulvescens]